MADETGLSFGASSVLFCFSWEYWHGVGIREAGIGRATWDERKEKKRKANRTFVLMTTVTPGCSILALGYHVAIAIAIAIAIERTISVSNTQPRQSHWRSAQSFHGLYARVQKT
jgi:hypothetical protein